MPLHPVVYSSESELSRNASYIEEFDDDIKRTRFVKRVFTILGLTVLDSILSISLDFIS